MTRCRWVQSVDRFWLFVRLRLFFQPKYNHQPLYETILVVEPGICLGAPRYLPTIGVVTVGGIGSTSAVWGAESVASG
jgi:hypothetical protein